MPTSYKIFLCCDGSTEPKICVEGLPWTWLFYFSNAVNTISATGLPLKWINLIHLAWEQNFFIPWVGLICITWHQYLKPHCTNESGYNFMYHIHHADVNLCSLAVMQRKQHKYHSLRLTDCSSKHKHTCPWCTYL